MDGAQSIELSSELIILMAIRQGRADFFDHVIEHAETMCKAQQSGILDPEDRKLLRSDIIAQIAELFFVMKEAGVSSPAALDAYLRRHNDEIKKSISECKRGYNRFGISKVRLESSLFSEGQIKFNIHESSNGSITFDQRSIAKLLCEAMSFESCRTALLILAKFNLINRYEFDKVVLIRPNGVIERMFRNHLATINKMICR